MIVLEGNHGFATCRSMTLGGEFMRYGNLMAAVLVLATTACQDSEIEKAVRSEVEGRGACAKPIGLTKSLADRLVAMGVLACKTDSLYECEAQTGFVNTIRVRPTPGFMGMPTGPFAKTGPHDVLLCGAGKLGKILDQQERTMGNDKIVDVRYLVNIEMSDGFKKSPQSKELASLFSLPESYESQMTLRNSGSGWSRR